MNYSLRESLVAGSALPVVVVDMAVGIVVVIVYDGV